ncbi:MULTISPECIES: UPF0223 family protein [Gemella]|uniref:UPF0223 family protein n=1 Tax=Gemella TaxID=1378 RepID=UPI00076802A8|nr:MULTISPECIES: UPF0223 family protein [Gemella]AME10045.1 hypothetical protein AXE85_07745 [Gemella sp. oral taxon 928]AXI26181.1 hypothetical protein CG018_01345 [Gemella sp. ND 6198]
MEFNYPINYSLYTPKEVGIIIQFLDIVELCYTKGVELNEYKKHYKAFKQIVKAKSEENNLYKDFKNITSFDGYLTTKAMKNENKIILIKS